MSQDQFTRLETLLAHHDEQIQTLSDIVSKQWKEIDILKKRLANTQAKVSELDSQTKDDADKNMTLSDLAAMDKPPHY